MNMYYTMTTIRIIHQYHHIHCPFNGDKVKAVAVFPRIPCESENVG